MYLDDFAHEVTAECLFPVCRDPLAFDFAGISNLTSSSIWTTRKQTGALETKDRLVNLDSMFEFTPRTDNGRLLYLHNVQIGRLPTIYHGLIIFHCMRTCSNKQEMLIIVRFHHQR